MYVPYVVSSPNPLKTNGFTLKFADSNIPLNNNGLPLTIQLFKKTVNIIIYAYTCLSPFCQR